MFFFQHACKLSCTLLSLKALCLYLDVIQLYRTLAVDSTFNHLRILWYWLSWCCWALVVGFLKLVLLLPLQDKIITNQIDGQRSAWFVLFCNICPKFTLLFSYEKCDYTSKRMNVTMIQSIFTFIKFVFVLQTYGAAKVWCSIDRYFVTAITIC